MWPIGPTATARPKSITRAIDCVDHHSARSAADTPDDLWRAPTSIRVEERKLWCGGRLVYNNGILLLLLLLLFHPGSPLWPDPLPAAGSGDVMLAWHKCGSGRDRTPTMHWMCKKIRLIFDPNCNYFAQFFFFPLTLLYLYIVQLVLAYIVHIIGPRKICIIMPRLYY